MCAPLVVGGIGNCLAAELHLQAPPISSGCEAAAIHRPSGRCRRALESPTRHVQHDLAEDVSAFDALVCQRDIIQREHRSDWNLEP